MTIKTTTKRIRALTAGAALGLALTLSACGGDEAAEAPVEGVVPGIEISNARLVLPPVSGNPSAIYFDVVYNGERGVSITGAEVQGASSTQVHGTMEYNFEMTMMETGPVALPGGEPKTFEPGGLHIMVYELDETVAAGDSVDVTLSIAGGRTHDFTAEVRAAGEER